MNKLLTLVLAGAALTASAAAGSAQAQPYRHGWDRHHHHGWHGRDCGWRHGHRYCR